MLKLKSAPAWWLALPAAGLLAGCGSYGNVRDGTTDQPVWPEIESARPIVPETVRPDLDKLRKVQAGLGKTEIYQLIGHPQYSEGLAGVHEWNFVFQLPDGKGGQATCQYKILYDDAMLAKQFHWNPQSCAELVNPPAAPPPVAAEQGQVTTLELSTDMLFEFDSARLRPEGIRVLDERVVAALTDASKLQRIRLTGHADRLGSDAYNLALSQRRADAVKAHLVGKGVPSESVEAVGRGEAESLVSCQQQSRSQLIACLAPNRRVRIEITVDK
ncbi:MAG TPA: OmpA family protein [Stenotrophomonas sp.]|nr:OmpA family protein [Stenotrophomonas sp.]